MENFKTKVQKRTRVLSVLMVITALLFAGLFFYRDQLPVLPSFIKGFHQGAFVGLEIVLLSFLLVNRKAAKNEDALKKLYIEENDERTSSILQQGSTLAMSILFFGLGLATVVAGFFNPVVFFTLMGVLLFVLVLFFSLWMYYAKKT